MAKQSIEWHEECLNNMKTHHARESKYLKDLQARCNLQKEAIERRAKQIARAKKEGKDGYDEDRYLV